MFHHVPLAWLQLSHEKLRLLAAVAEITFAVVLMLMQLGFRDSVLSASSLVQDRLRADPVLTSTQYDYLLLSDYFTRRRVYQALAFDGVESAWPVYLGFAQWKNPEDLQRAEHPGDRVRSGGLGHVGNRDRCPGPDH